MKSIRSCLLVSLVVVVFIQCDKDKDTVTVHCENLVNEVLPAGDNGRIDAPNAFTPNGDGINDAFRPLTVELQSISVRIYDDNSNLVFQSAQAGSNWAPNLGSSRYQKFYYRLEGVTLGNKKIGICGEVYALSCYPQGMNPNEFRFEDQYTPGGFTGVTNETLLTCN